MPDVEFQHRELLMISCSFTQVLAWRIVSWVRARNRILCEIHCFSANYVSPMTSKSEQTQSHRGVYIINEA